MQFERYHDHFFNFSEPVYDASSYGSTFKIPSINNGLNPNLKRDATTTINTTTMEQTITTTSEIELPTTIPIPTEPPHDQAIALT